MPVTVLALLGGLWVSGPNAADYAQQPLLFLLAAGVSFVLLSVRASLFWLLLVVVLRPACSPLSCTRPQSRMIVSHMCKIPFTPQFRVIVPFALVVANAYAPALGLRAAPPVRPLLAAWLYAAFILAVYAHYLVHVVRDICDYLNIYLLKIRQKPE